MANPLMSDKAFDDAAKAGWGAPAGPAAPRGAAFAPPSPMDAGGGTYSTPISDGPVSEWHGGVMTVNGTITATGVLMVLLLGVGGRRLDGRQAAADGAQVQFPWIAILGVIVGFGCVIAAMFRPMWAKFLAPIYALAEGFFVGVISRYYETYQHGIVLQADRRHASACSP